jgi:ferric-dicitrate binding protein FerR (iron transport regulator)
MAAAFKPSDEFAELVALLADGSLSDDQERRLADLLRNDADARAYYIAHAALITSLQWEYAEGEAVRDEPRAHTLPRSGRWLRRIVSYGLVASIAIGLTILNFSGIRTWRTPGEATPSIGTLTTQEGACRLGDGSLLQVGQRIGLGHFLMETGTAQLALDSGATVVLAGPADLELESAVSARLHSGRATIRAPKSASGFTLKTPASDFVDLGTEFGIAINEDHSSEVHVFEGLVLARPTASDLIVPVRNQEAAHVEADSGDVTSVPANAARFPRMVRPALPFVAQPAAYPPLPDGARVVFAGKNTTDRETHLLLINQALATLPDAARPKLFNGAFGCPLGFAEAEIQRYILLFHPTHVVLEFNTEMSLEPTPREPDRFRADIVRFVDRLTRDRVTPILCTGFPVGKEKADRQPLLDRYNLALRELASERGLRLVDTDAHICAHIEDVTTVLTTNGAGLNFAGARELAAAELIAFGHPNAVVPNSLNLALLPGVVRDWQIHKRPKDAWLDAETVAQLRPDESWSPLTLPQPLDPFLARIPDRGYSGSCRDRTIGFATDLFCDSKLSLEALATIPSESERDAFLNLGGSVSRIWLNNVKVFDGEGRWVGWHAGKERIAVHLQKGPNHVVIECSNCFFLSVTDTLDWPIPVSR